MKTKKAKKDTAVAIKLQPDEYVKKNAKGGRKDSRTVRRRAAYRLVHLYQIDRCVLRTGSGERELWRKVTDLGYSRRPINASKEG